MNLATLSRMVENMIRIGTIAEIDHATRRVRVKSGELLTDWLKWRAERAGATRCWNPPTLGEQVMILSPSGELANGIVIPSIYSDAHDAPSSNPAEHVTEYPGGARIVYNHETSQLSIIGIAMLSIDASGDIVINNAGSITETSDGKHTIKANLVDIDGGAPLFGAVCGNDVCAFTGLPHGQFSATVKVSK